MKYSLFNVRKILSHKSLRAQLLTAFIVPSVLILLSALAVYINLEMAMKRTMQVEHEIRVDSVSGDLLRAVLDAETGERGYVITGNPDFLEPYEDAIKEFSHLMDAWRNLAAPSELQRLEMIEDLFSQWQNEVAKPVIEAREQAPGRLVSRGFDALYHISFLDDVLAGRAELPEVEEVEFVDELLRNISYAANSASTTAQANEWAKALDKARHLPALYTRAMTLPEDNEARELALALTDELFDLVRGLTHIAVEAEDKAVDIISSGDGKVLTDKIRIGISQAEATQNGRINKLISKTRNQMIIAQWFAIILPIVGVFLSIFLLLLLHSDILKSIKKLQKVATDVARGELDSRIDNNRSDELGDLAHNFNQMAENLQTARTEREMLDIEIGMLDGLQTMLVSSKTEAEAYASAARVCQRLLTNMSGVFYATAASRNLTQAVQRWGDDLQSAKVLSTDVFHPSDCRALRVGQVHYASVDSAEIFCDHLDQKALAASACIPLMSQDETLGSLSIYRTADHPGEIKSRELTLAKTVTYRLALALSNLRLAEKLRAQSIRDPLTGLFNRRYLEETLEREIVKVNRENNTLSVIAFDVDHFKRFNDEFGHEAGDMVLKLLGEQMRNVVRGSDIACRVGGEEFLLVLPEANTDIAVQRAEDLRQKVESVNLNYQGRSLGKITISLGVATLSSQSIDQDTLLRKADLALYQAKHQGRNKVVSVSEDE